VGGHPVPEFQSFGERFTTLGAWMWHVIGWVWSTVIVAGVLVSLLVSYAATGRLEDPRSWVILGFLGAHPVVAATGLGAAILLTLGAYLAHRAQRQRMMHRERGYQETIVTLGRGVHHLLEEAQKKSPPTSTQTPNQHPAIRTPDQRVRVFISSTLEELAPERKAAREAIAELHLTPVFFEAGARPYPPRELYRAYLAQSDIFVGVYWQRYGWVAASMEISGLEDEYRLSGGKPRLIYVKSPAPDRESGLDALLDRIRTEDVASYKQFATPGELRELLANDLAVLLTDRFTQPHETPLPKSFAPLPVSRGPLIDRERERATIEELLLREDVGLVTVTGPGGVGKTRVAEQVAAEVAARFSDGVAFVPLSALKDADLVVPTITQAFHLSPAPGQSAIDCLVHYLQHQRLLLVVDNFEHVIAAARKVAQILELSPGLTVLATSREPLRVRGEQVAPIFPLALPGPAGVSDLDRLGQVAAVALFVERAGEARPSFALTTENADAVEEICRRLDGLPLALELTAAVLSVLTPAALLARLEQHLPLPARGARDLPERQQTMRNTIAWSYDLLGPGEQRLFRRLAVFAGGFTLEAVQAVCADANSGSARPADDSTVLEQLAHLLDKSLVQAQPDTGAQPRFTMLETIREYAQEQLAASGEEADVRRRHVAYYLAKADLVPLTHPPDQWKEMHLEREGDNLRDALDWALEDDDTDSALGLCGCLGWYWFLGNQEEGRRRLRHVLDTAPTSRTLHRARALIAYGLVLAWHRGDESARAAREALSIYQEIGDARGAAAAKLLIVLDPDERGELPQVQRLLGEAEAAFRAADDRVGEATVWQLRTEVGLQVGDLELASKAGTMALNRFRELGDMWGVAGVLGDLAETARRRGDYRAALQMCEESLTLARAHGIRYVEQEELLRLGNLCTLLGEHDRAAKLHGESLDLANRIGDRVGAAHVYEGMGLLARRRGDPALAAQYHREALAIYRELGHRTGIRVRALPGPVQALSLSSLGYCQEMLGDLVEAERCHREALAMAREHGATLTIVLCIDGLAGVAAAGGQAERAARLLGSAAAIRARIGAPLVQPERADVDRAASAARRALGGKAFDRAYRHGQALDLDGAMKQAGRPLSSGDSYRGGPTGQARL
jgi:predicted ATPase